MIILTIVLFLISGTCDGVQKLTCPYGQKHEGLPRVWCKQTSTLCCTGFSFSKQSQFLDAGRLEVTQDADSFTVNVLSLAQGDGIYWCGVLAVNDTIIKLSEEYFYSNSFVWDILRWILMPLLPMATIFCYFYRKQQDKKHDILYMNDAVTSGLTQNYSQNEDMQQITELE
ncbi:uncharacterized protein si:ch211-102c2.4 [Esox lucius]|uniref:uncharacterized protein si:ch211-102c2.4 n=1 Tax=Esox lucius TaxID=8010 RepID=UPI001476C660|nr:uncharacterized protein si:ch211-102c2.4 [Esox lucius]